jgi:hypothetical protein
MSGRVMIEFQLPWGPIPTRWTRSRQIGNLSAGRLEPSPKRGTQADGNDRPFAMGRRLICGFRPMPTGLRPRFAGNGQGLWGKD